MDRRRWMSAQGESKFTLPALFLFYSGLQWIGWWPPTLVTMIFTQSTHSNANLFQKNPYRHVLPAIWASLSPVNLTCKINHHTRPVQMPLPQTESWAGTTESSRTQGWSSPVLSTDGHPPKCNQVSPKALGSVLRDRQTGLPCWILISQRVYTGREGHNMLERGRAFWEVTGHYISSPWKCAPSLTWQPHL